MRNITIQEYKQKIIKKQDKIILLTGVFLIAIIAFGLGRLSVNLIGSDEPMQIIENNLFKASAGLLTTEFNNAGQGTLEQNFVGSRNSDKYHLPDCQWAKRIKKENQIWFSSEQDAQNQGYKPGSCIFRK